MPPAPNGPARLSAEPLYFAGLLLSWRRPNPTGRAPRRALQRGRASIRGGRAPPGHASEFPILGRGGLRGMGETSEMVKGFPDAAIGLRIRERSGLKILAGPASTAPHQHFMSFLRYVECRTPRALRDQIAGRGRRTFCVPLSRPGPEERMLLSPIFVSRQRCQSSSCLRNVTRLIHGFTQKQATIEVPNEDCNDRSVI
jgi:hypothetical protein